MNDKTKPYYIFWLLLVVLLSGCSKEVQESIERTKKENNAHEERMLRIEWDGRVELAQDKAEHEKEREEQQQAHERLEQKQFQEAVVPLVGFVFVVGTIGGLYGFRQYIVFAGEENARNRESDSRLLLEKHKAGLEFISEHFPLLSDEHKTIVLNKLEGSPQDRESFKKEGENPTNKEEA